MSSNAPPDPPGTTGVGDAQSAMPDVPYPPGSAPSAGYPTPAGPYPSPVGSYPSPPGYPASSTPSGYPAPSPVSTAPPGYPAASTPSVPPPGSPPSTPTYPSPPASSSAPPGYPPPPVYPIPSGYPPQPTPYGIQGPQYAVEPPTKKPIWHWIVLAVAFAVAVGVVGIVALNRVMSMAPSAGPSSVPSITFAPPSIPPPAPDMTNYIGKCFSMTALAVLNNEGSDQIVNDLAARNVDCDATLAQVRVTGALAQSFLETDTPPSQCNGSDPTYRCWWVDFTVQSMGVTMYQAVAFETIPHVGECYFGYIPSNVGPSDVTQAASWSEYLGDCSEKAPTWMTATKHQTDAATQLGVATTDIQFTQFTITDLGTEALECPADQLSWGFQYSTSQKTHVCTSMKPVS